VKQERRHRSLIYSADYAAMNELVAFLMENCCGGSECETQPRAVTDAERKSA
jgi:hypothetical protein